MRGIFGFLLSFYPCGIVTSSPSLSRKGGMGQKNAIGCNEKRKFLPQLSNFFAKKRHFITNEQMTRGLDAHQSGSLSLQSGSLSEQDYRDYTMYRTKFYLYPQKELLHEVVSCLSHNLQNRVRTRIAHRTPARRERWGGATLCFVGCLSAYAILDIFLSPFHLPWIGFLSS